MEWQGGVTAPERTRKGGIAALAHGRATPGGSESEAPPSAMLARGEVPEWFKGAVLKTAEAKVSGSSNLPLSASLTGFDPSAPNL